MLMSNQQPFIKIKQCGQLLLLIAEHGFQNIFVDRKFTDFTTILTSVGEVYRLY